MPKLRSTADITKPASAPPEYTDPLDIEIGARLRALRESRGLTMAGMARMMNTPAMSLQRLEMGRNTLRPARLLAVARVLEVSPGWFFEGMMDPKFKPKATNAFELLSRENAGLFAKLASLTPLQKSLLVSIADEFIRGKK